MLNTFDMDDCKPSSTPIAHGVVLCRDYGARIVDPGQLIEVLLEA